MEWRKLFSIIGFPLLFLLIIGVSFFFREELIGVFRSVEDFREQVASAGIVAPFLFLGLQFIQVIIFIIPGEIPQLAGGYLFGVIGGTLLSMGGILAGSMVNFFLGRALGRPFVEQVFGKSRMAKFEGMIASKKAQTGFFLLFLIPGIPKDALCYLGGLSKIGIFPFFLISMIGRFPALLGSSLIGSAVADRNWILLSITAVIVVLIAGMGFIYHEKIHSWITRIR